MPRTRQVRTLDPQQTDDLLQYLGECLDGTECDEAMRHVETFLHSRGVDPSVPTAERVFVRGVAKGAEARPRAHAGFIVARPAPPP